MRLILPAMKGTITRGWPHTIQLPPSWLSAGQLAGATGKLLPAHTEAC